LTVGRERQSPFSGLVVERRARPSIDRFLSAAQRWHHLNQKFVASIAKESHLTAVWRPCGILQSTTDGTVVQDLLIATIDREQDQALFASFPGAGPVCAPRLAAAFGTDRSRWQSATELQSHSGIAPVTERSGKALWIHHRLACPKFVKQTFHEFADQSIRFSQWARAYYDQQRGRGNDHHAALRSLAYKWIRILYRCWKDGTPYDEATYMDALRRHGSSLVKNNT